MFGRSFLIALSVVSLAWISYVSYDLLNSNQKLNPENIFSVHDGKILIINRNQEVQINELDYSFNQQSKPLIDLLLSSVYPDEQIYISEKRPIVLVQTQNLWSDDLVLKFLKTKGLSYVKKADNTYLVNSIFELKFKGNNLLFSKKNLKLAHLSDQVWPIWDNLASASIIYLSKPLKSTNIYFKKNGTISYETNLAKEFTSAKVDDADLFSQELPASLTDYRFFEKKFAIKTNMLSESSPLHEWLEDGFVLFNYENTPCLMSDYNKVADPFAILNSLAETTSTENFFETELLKGFPQYFENGFHVEKVGDKILISNKKETINKIIADYQIGNTLALNEDNYQLIYDRLPKKVSERMIGRDKKYALSTYKTLEIKTVLASNGPIKPIKEAEKTNSYISFGIQGELLQIMSGLEAVYGFSDANKVSAFQNKKQIWQLAFDGNLLGEAKEIDLLENGKRQVLFNTKSAIYLVNNQGNKINEFPLECPSSNPVSSYKWNGKTSFLVVNINNELLQIDENGRILKKLKLTCGEVTNEVDVYRNQGKLLANVRGKNEFITVDLERNKISKKYPKISSESVALKTDVGYEYYFISGNGLMKSSPDNQEKNVISSNNLKNVKRYKFQKLQFLTCTDGKTIYIIDQQSVVKRISVNQKDIEDYDILFADNLVKNIALLDGVQNKIKIFDSNGKQATQKLFDGKNKVKLSLMRQQLCLTTYLQNNVVQYFDLLAE